MDKSIFTQEFKIVPGKDGSFIVMLQDSSHTIGSVWGFSNVDDLIAWLQKQSKQLV